MPFSGWSASKRSIASRANAVCLAISLSHASSCARRVRTMMSHAAWADCAWPVSYTHLTLPTICSV
eukprot:3661092-Prymnesium_polylepis.1